MVTAAQLPFTSNQGYVYRQTEKGWVPNEVDYLLLRTPIPVQGGFVYMITFGGGKELCGRWSIDARHPDSFKGHSITAELAELAEPSTGSACSACSADNGANVL